MFGSQQECLEQCYFQLFPCVVVALWGSIGGKHSHLCHCQSLCYAVVAIVTGSSYIAIVVEGSKCLFYVGVYHRRKVEVRRFRKQEKSCHISYSTWQNLFFFICLYSCMCRPHFVWPNTSRHARRVVHLLSALMFPCHKGLPVTLSCCHYRQHIKSFQRFLSEDVRSNFHYLCFTYVGNAEVPLVL